MLEVGTKVAIKVGNRFGKRATHEVVGHSPGYGPLICPIEKVDQIQPGQTSVPVSRITEDRLAVR